MIKAFFEKQNIKKTGGGYGYKDPVDGDYYIFISPDLEDTAKLLAVIHEVMECHLGKQVSHKRFDRMAIDAVDSLLQLGLVR
jgi:hypothetical protein